MPTQTTYTEQELIALLQQKSREGFNYVYKQYSAALFGIIKKVVADENTAQDVLQEAFVKIYKNVEKYDATKGRLYTWMLNIARNTAIDKLRSKGEVMQGKIQKGDDIVYGSEHEQQTEQATDTIGLRKIVDELDPQYKTIVELAYFKGFTLNEIAKSTETPLGTVKTRMRKAINVLRKHYSS